MFSLVITPSAKRSAKKLPRTILEEILARCNPLKENPYAGEKLSGSLHFLYSLHLIIQGTHYRVAYTIDHEQTLIVVHLIGPREGFYQRLKRLLG